MVSHPLLAHANELPARAGVPSVSALRVLDCRFALLDPAAGRSAYDAGHIPGADFLDLTADLSGPVGPRGGRHPLPDPARFMARLAALGIGLETPVIAYDDNRLAGAARLWWLCQALGYRHVRVLAGGWAAWLAAGGQPDTAVPEPDAVPLPPVAQYQGAVDREAAVAAQAAGALLVDAREPRRYAGLEEPIDPIAGHIPGALNLPWQEVTDPDGYPRSVAEQRERWAALDAEGNGRVVAYCGSGITACVNLLSLELAGRPPGLLYNGSWSDWCAWLKATERGC